METLLAHLCQVVYASAGAKSIPKGMELMPLDGVMRKLIATPKTPEELYEAAQAVMGKAGIKVIT